MRLLTLRRGSFGQAMFKLDIASQVSQLCSQCVASAQMNERTPGRATHYSSHAIQRLDATLTVTYLPGRGCDSAQLLQREGEFVKRCVGLLQFKGERINWSGSEMKNRSSEQPDRVQDGLS